MSNAHENGNSAKPNDLAATLKERGSRHGEFRDHARYTQSLKRVLCSSPNWDAVEDMHREALEMIVHKIGRILAGDPNYADHWHDIAGYATLVDDHLQVPAPAPEIKDGPYCSFCENNLADFSNPRIAGMFICSNCAVEDPKVDTTTWDCMGGL